MCYSFRIRCYAYCYWRLKKGIFREQQMKIFLQGEEKAYDWKRSLKRFQALSW